MIGAPHPECPKSIEFIATDDMPRTATGKSLHRILRDRHSEQGGGRALPAAHAASLSLRGRIWRCVETTNEAMSTTSSRSSRSIILTASSSICLQ